MTRKYAKLTKDWCLRGWTDVQWAAVNWTNADLFELSKKSFYVAEACDGLTNFASLAFLPDHRALLDTMIDKGIAEICEEGDAIELWQKYRKADNPFLREIQWCVTGFCNLKCLHCYMQSPSGRYKQLSFDDMMRIIEQFEYANVMQVSLTGGEPLMRRDLLNILNALAQKKIWVSEIYSNGLLITEEFLNAVKTIGFLPYFQISFDGHGGHDYMRGRKGLEERVIDAIRKLRRAGFPVIVASNIDSVNVKCLDITYDLLLDLDIQAWRIGVPLDMGNWKNAATNLSLDEQVSAYSSLLDRWLKDSRPFEIVLGPFLRAAAHGRPAPEENLKLIYTPESYDCGSIRENPNLLPDGTLLPCPAYVDSALEAQMPNILSEGLSNVWTKSLLRKLADMSKSDLLAQNEACRHCELFGNCGMGCRASALRATGSLMAKDPVACELWKGRYKQHFHELISRIPKGA